MSYIKHLTRSLVVGMLLMQTSIALADDIAGPDWERYAPYTTVQEWEFDSSAGGLPDGDSVQLFNPNGDPDALHYFGLTHMPLGQGPSGDNGWMGGPEGGFLGFVIPNIADNRPVKHLRIQINGDWGIDNEPYVIDLFGVLGPAVLNGIFAGSDETIPGSHRWEDWDIFPNPEQETLTLMIPAGAFVNQVVIDTISAVPLPPAVILFGSALIGLVGMARRKDAGTRRPAA